MATFPREGAGEPGVGKSVRGGGDTWEGEVRV